MKKKSILCCPICNKPIIEANNKKSLVCEKMHTYDIAKQSYVNLLLSHEKRSNNPGESKEMIKVRRDFLDKGFYEPIAEGINQIIKGLAHESNPLNILDLGCGEGFYLNRLQHFFQGSGSSNQYYGVDISKEALKLAGTRNPSITWAVASNFSLPFSNSSIDFLLSIFSPIEDEECFRVLKNKGYFIRVLPNPDHLIELREVIYSRIDERREGKIDSKKLNCIQEASRRYTLRLGQEDLHNLFKMTPHYWKISGVDRIKVDLIESMDITIDVNISVFQK